MKIFADIETIPTQKPAIQEYLKGVAYDKAVTAIQNHASYKDDTKEAKIKALHKDTLGAEAILKTSLDGAFGEVICISWAHDDSDVMTLHRKLGESEKDLLRHFFSDLNNVKGVDMATWVGHKIIDFDVLFLQQRAMVNGVKPLLPTESHCFDTMTRWAGKYNRDKYPSLDKLCMAFGVESPKQGITGADVWPMVERGEYEKLIQYSQADVQAVREVYKKMRFED